MPDPSAPDLVETDDSAFARLWGQGRRTEDSLDQRLAMAATGREIGAETPPVLLGRFTVGRSLGRGGQGCVYDGFDPILGRRVALKISRFRHEGASRDLRFEARALAQIHHPNIVTVYALEVFDDRPVVVMELVEGTPLLDWIAQHDPSRAAIVELIAKVGDGLAALHRAGLAHRDVKPANLLVDGSGAPRLVDLGLAAYAGDLDVGLGTPAYAAPEQLRGAPADPMGDQYGLAATLRAALAAWSAGQDTRTQARRAVNTIPPRLAAILDRALADDPAQRHADVAAFARALRASPRRRIGAITAALGGVLFIAAAPAFADAPCGRDAEAWTRQAWSPQIRAGLAAHFDAIPHEVGPESFAVAADALDDYTRQWSDAVAVVCASAAGPAWDDPRAQCLDDGAHELEVITAELAGLDEHTASVAPLLARALPSPEHCIADVDTLAPATSHADEVEVRRSISVARRRCQYGLTPDCAAELDRIETSARAQGVDACVFEPTLLLERGLDAHTGAEAGKDLEILEAALLAAERCSLDAVKLDAQRLLAERFARRGDTDAADLHLRGAEATLDRMGRPRSDAVALLATRSTLLLSRGAAQASAEAAEQALALHRDVGYGSAGERAQLLGMLSAAVFELGDSARATALQVEALAIRREEFGPRHPLVAFELANMAVSLAESDEAAARELNREAIAIFDVHASGHELSLAICLSHEAESAIAAGELESATASNDRALALFAAMGHADLPFTGDALVDRSRIRLARRELDGARADAENAITLLTRTRGAADSTTLDAQVQLAAVFAARGETAKAETLACAANTAFVAAYGESHPLAAQFARRCTDPAGER